MLKMDKKVENQIRDIIRSEIKNVLKDEEEAIIGKLSKTFDKTIEHVTKDLIKKMEKIILYNLPLVLTDRDD